MADTFNPFTKKPDFLGSGSSSLTVDTKTNILALTPSSPQTALATDTGEFFVWDGTNWNVGSIALSTELPAPDMGASDDNDKHGYSWDYITNKTIYNSVLGGSTNAVEGGIRINHETTPKTLDIYENGAWRSLKVFSFDGVLYHVINTTTIEVHTGNSTTLDINDQPLIQNYKIPMGASAGRQFDDAGTF